MENNELKGLPWYGYRYTNGKIQVKRYFDSSDIMEVKESEFVKEVTPVFTAIDREDAIKQTTEILFKNWK